MGPSSRVLVSWVVGSDSSSVSLMGVCVDSRKLVDQGRQLLFLEGSAYRPFMSLRNIVTSSLVVRMFVLWEKTVSNASADSFV